MWIYSHIPMQQNIFVNQKFMSNIICYVLYKTCYPNPEVYKRHAIYIPF